MTTFVIRLIAPRPTFALDITDEERVSSLAAPPRPPRAPLPRSPASPPPARSG
jgi:hypothetical protein